MGDKSIVENCKYNPNLVYGNKIQKEFLCVYREIFSESCKSKTNLDYNYPFPIDLEPIRIPIGAEYI